MLPKEATTVTETVTRKQDFESHRANFEEEGAKEKHFLPVLSDESLVPLQIRLFGTFRLHCHGVDAPKPRSRAAHWVLAWLVLRSKVPLERIWLAEMLWPGIRRESALFNLRRNLTEVRKILGAEAYRLQSPTPHTLAFDATGCDCDLLTFETALHRKDVTSSVTALERAVALYTGDLLEGCREDWILPERRRCEQQYFVALERLATHEDAHGEWEKAAYWLRLLTSRAPEREAAHRHLMEVLAKQGDFAAVTEVYRHLRLRLRETLNTSPAEQTVALYEHLKQQAFAPSQSPSIPAEQRPSIAVPRPLGELIGREGQLEAVARKLAETRLLTLTGAGGIGKTRLAMALAEAEGDGFRDRVVWVELAPLTSKTQVAKQIADALHLSERRNEPSLQTVTDFLRTRNLLLVLDNCEHLLDACASLARHLLNACAEVNILATSRQALGLFGENVWRVASLTIPREAEAQNLLEAVGETGAARLFLARAQAVQQTFQLTARNASAVARICHQLDGIPLALELAAVWVPTLSAEEIARRLDDQFTLLQRGDRTAAPRHQTLRNAMDWSYALLELDEQRLLRRLSVFVGGWTLDAAEAVAAINEAERERTLWHLGSLREKSLVEAGERNGAIGYRLLEPVRQYALQGLHKAGEESVIRQQHFLFCVEAAERQAELLDGPHLLEGLARMNADYANFRAALQFGLTCPPEAKLGRQTLWLVIALNRYGVVSGRYQENWDAMEEAMRRFPAHDDIALRADALQTVAVTVSKVGDMEAVRRYAGEAEHLYRNLAPCAGQLVALRTLGNAAMATGDYALARSFFVRGLAISQSINDRNNEARMQLSLGILTKFEGDLPQAQTLLEAAVRHFEASGLLIDAGVAHHNLANVLKEREDWTGAKRHYLRSLAIHRQIDNRLWIGINLSILAFLLEEENPAEAQRLAEESLVYSRHNRSVSIPHCLQLLSRIACRQGDLLQSRAYIEEAINLQVHMDVKRDLSYALLDACTLLIAEGSPARAAQLLTATAALRETIAAPFAPEDQPTLDKLSASCRAAIGDEAIAAAQQRGKTMTLADAVALASPRSA